MSKHHRLTVVFIFVLVALSSGEVGAQGQPEGQLTIAFDASIAPTFLDPAETSGIATPFVFLYALHDALIKPLPGNNMAPCLAESWRESPDVLVFEFKLREGLKFHNGDPFTAEDVKFSFQRSKGARVLKEKVREIEIAGPYRVRFHLHEPFRTSWPSMERSPRAPVGSCPGSMWRELATTDSRSSPSDSGPTSS